MCSSIDYVAVADGVAATPAVTLAPPGGSGVYYGFATDRDSGPVEKIAPPLNRWQLATAHMPIYKTLIDAASLCEFDLLNGLVGVFADAAAGSMRPNGGGGGGGGGGDTGFVMLPAAAAAAAEDAFLLGIVVAFFCFRLDAPATQRTDSRRHWLKRVIESQYTDWQTWADGGRDDCLDKLRGATTAAELCTVCDLVGPDASDRFLSAVFGVFGLAVMPEWIER